MEFRKVRALRGPNIWASFPVLEAWVDLGQLKDSPSDELPGFNERLMTWLPSMIEHRCSVGTRGGFFERLRRGTYQAHILEHVVLELQSLAGTEVGFGRTRETNEDGVYKVAFEYEVEELGRACLEVGQRLCLAAVHDLPFDVEAELRTLQELAQQVCPKPGLAALLRAAARRKIPVRRLNDGDLLQLGQGARQRRLLGCQVDRTSALGEMIAGREELTRSLLRQVGVPVPGDEPVAGASWRLLVVGDRVAAAARREPLSDVTSQVHPEVAARAVEAARVIGLEVAGVDVVASTLSQPLEEQGGVVVGVDAHPDLGLHVQDPEKAPAADAILNHLFPTGQTGRIPVAAVTGVNGKTTTTRLLAHIVARSQRCVGMTCTEGIYVDGRRIESGDCSGPLSARMVLQHPRVEAAVLETARGGILRAGLGFDFCDVAVVTNIGEGDHLGLADIDTVEQLARVKRTVVESVAKTGAAVLKANDPLVVDMARYCPGSVVYFARNGNDPVIVEHRGRKGRVAFVREGHIILAEGNQEIPLVPLKQVPLTHGGRIGFQIENALAAAAAAWSLGIPCEIIRVGLETFVSGLHKAPARFNVLEINGGTVIMDYGHNVSSLAALIEALDEFPNQRRTVVYSAAGDRRNEDLIRQGQLLGEAFDRVLLYEEENCIRGRKPGEIAGLFRQGLEGSQRVTEIEEVQGAVQAAEIAMRSLQPGELCLIQVDLVDETVRLAELFLASGNAGREVDLREILKSYQAETASVV